MLTTWRNSIMISMVLGGMLLSGCAGYKLGPVNGQVAGARSVRVKFFSNETLEPRLRTAVNRSLRQHLQQEGTLRLKTRGEEGEDGDFKADLVVSGSLTSLTRNGVNYKPADVLEVSDYNLSLTANIKVTESVTGKVILSRVVTGATTVRVGADLSSSERQAVPLIADELARRATALIVDGDWGEAGAGDSE